jgi:ribosome-binding protein aMBF1 (putative translation factor)
MGDRCLAQLQAIADDNARRRGKPLTPVSSTELAPERRVAFGHTPLSRTEPTLDAAPALPKPKPEPKVKPAKPLPVDYSAVVRADRARLGLTQNAFAALIGTTWYVINRVEGGERMKTSGPNGLLAARYGDPPTLPAAVAVPPRPKAGRSYAAEVTAERQALSLNKAQFAELLGVSWTTIDTLERGGIPRGHVKTLLAGRYENGALRPRPPARLGPVLELAAADSSTVPNIQPAQPPSQRDNAIGAALMRISDGIADLAAAFAGVARRSVA